MPYKVVTKSLRYRLFWLAAVAIVPFAMTAVVGLMQIASERRAETQQTATELARALTHSVDAELTRTIAILEVLAQAAELERDDLPAFYERCRLIADKQPFWFGLSLIDAGKQPVFSTRHPFSQPPPNVFDEASWRQVATTLAPAVGGMALFRDNWAFAVRVPVLRNGKLRYVLNAPVSPAAIHSVLARQKISADWTVAVFDHQGLRVARSRAHQQNLGAPATPTLQALMQRFGSEGAGTARTVEGERVHTGFSRRSEYGWFAVVGLPDAKVQSAILRQVLMQAAGFLVSCLLCLYLASLASRKVTEPMNSLRRAAQALGLRKPIPEVESGVREIDEVVRSLSAALKELEVSEAQRDALLKAREEALERAEKAARAKDEFLAVLGHELRNPLSPIVTSLHLMDLKGEQGTQRERAIIRRQVTQMKRLVDDLLDVSHITTGRIELKKSVIDLNEVVEQAVEAVAPAPGTPAPRLSVRLAPSPLQVNGDEVRLVQVVSNLLVNALKFTPADGGVEVAVQSMDGQAQIQVSDTGQGIPKDFIPQVFDLFSQASRSGARPSEGLGLGLAIVKNLVDRHGGQVRAHSDGPGSGSCFTVSIPTAGSSEDRPFPLSAQVHSGGQARLLIVDDNVDAAESLASLLGLYGYDVRTKHHPRDALQALEAFTPDLAILDIGLPGMDGYELARQIRAHPAWAGGAALVAMTGFGQPADRLRAREAGFDAHLTKPVDSDKLLSVLSSLSPGPRPRERRLA